MTKENKRVNDIADSFFDFLHFEATVACATKEEIAERRASAVAKIRATKGATNATRVAKEIENGEGGY